MEIDNVQTHFCLPTGLSNIRKRTKILIMYPVISRRAVKRTITTKIKEILMRPPLSGQDMLFSFVSILFQTLIKRAIDINPMAIPKSKGKKPGPGLSMVPIEYFLDSNMRKAPNRTNKILLIFLDVIILNPANPFSWVEEVYPVRSGTGNALVVSESF